MPDTVNFVVVNFAHNCQNVIKNRENVDVYIKCNANFFRKDVTSSVGNVKRPSLSLNTYFPRECTSHFATCSAVSYKALSGKKATLRSYYNARGTAWFEVAKCFIKALTFQDGNFSFPKAGNPNSH